MTDSTPEPEALEDDGVLQPADALDDDDLRADPLDTGLAPADHWSAGMGYGSTEAEARAGESLDQLLSEEEPDLDPYADDTSGEEPRAGRLVAGAQDLIATDVGIDGGAAGAEEAAVHVMDDEEG